MAEEMNALSTEMVEDSHDEHDHHQGPYPEQPLAQLTYPRNNITLGLALVGGIGVTLMIAAGAIGVVDGAQADNEIVGLLFWSGTAAVVAAMSGWMVATRPWEIFPSVTEGYYDTSEEAAGHSHDEDDHAPALPAEAQSHGH